MKAAIARVILEGHAAKGQLNGYSRSIRIMTNREWLRSLTDEELADFFIDDKRSLNGGICNICAHDCYCMYDEKLKCDNGIATWLKQEYKGVSDYD